MYAIVEIAGHQYKVRKDQKLYVNRLEGKEGSKVSFDKVMLTDDNGKVQVGAPVISGISVDAKIVQHLKADKVLIFKKKRRKGHQKLNGHRQQISQIEVTGIGKGSGKAKAKAAPKAESSAAAEKTAAKEDAPKKAAPKKTSAKSTAKKEAGSTAAKSETTKKAAPKKSTTAKKSGGEASQGGESKDKS
jgi:large subunit ribosomal protein L21